MTSSIIFYVTLGTKALHSLNILKIYLLLLPKISICIAAFNTTNLHADNCVYNSPNFY